MARQRLNSGNAAEKELPKAKLNKQSLQNVGRLLKYIQPYRAKFFGGLVFLILSSLTGLAFPGFFGALIDAAQGKQRYAFIPANLTTIGEIAITVLFLQGFISYFRITWFVQVAEQSLADIRRDTYFKMVTLPMDFFANRRVGELNSRISADLSQIQDTLTTTIAEAIRQLIILVGGIILLTIVSIKLTFALLVVLPFLIAVAMFFGKFIRNLSRQAQDKLAESNTIVEETLQGIANVKAFVSEAFEANRYDRNLREVVNLAVRGSKYRGMFGAFIVFCLFGVIFCEIWYGSYLVSIHDHGFTFGKLTTFIVYAAFISAAMGSLPDLYANIQKAVGSSERVLEILNEQGEPISITETDNNIKQTLKGNLSFRHINFHYPSRPEIEVLKDVTLEAKAGQKVAIVGPSGSGKSTMASLILQFYHPQSGTMLFDGAPVSDYALTDIRNQVAIVPQDVLLFGGSIFENIAYGKRNASREEVIQAAKRANAHQFITGFPEGYDTIVGERGVKLSGGQRQRIAIARALLKNPAILILDEATSSLDSESERLVQEALEELMKGRTSIIIAHRLSTIREADQIVVLEKGRIIESGTHEELISHEQGLYRYLSQLQFDATA
ncbi:ATP-binding cassette domain-containing protein [Mucilaginibacter robiniae]|uniref:ATP-binding cassette domain-containing protein n=1 Tax=Mucilaginibacter robiniae TaxID=2728022 RepID=A0A7L5E429_9SPHI|nr:ABC transporter transmembrane domain-containing protein [Mucilaginibacter robiniae]QJD97835.1 ATP-binding cassette domain-containing protein [Mucilaginibacter robiniae]